MNKPNSRDKLKANSKNFIEEEKQFILEQQKKYDERESFYNSEESVFLTGEVLLKILDENSKIKD